MTSATPKQYGIFPTQSVPQHYLIDYWTKMYESGRLRYRLCDIRDPTLKDVHDMLANPQMLTFNVYEPERDELTGEIMLCNFTGKAAQLHYSTHPDNTPQHNQYLCRSVTDDILDRWTEAKGSDIPFLYSLYGLVPVTNRVACAYGHRMGFKKMGVLPFGQRMNGDDFVDAMVFIKISKRIE